MTHSPIGSTPPSNALDLFLRNSYEVVQKVHDKLPAIEAVADHLTPVEDLRDFQEQVELLHGRLGLLVAASEIIIRASDAGIDLLIAENAPAQRVLLGLKSAALYDKEYFASKEEFLVLVGQLTALSDVVDGILLTLADKVDRSELQEFRDLIQGLEDRLGDFDAGNGELGGRLTYIEQALLNGDYWEILQQRTVLLEAAIDNPVTGNSALASALQQLTISITETVDGVEAVASDLTELTTRVSNAETGLAGETSARHLLESRTSHLEGTVISQATDLTELRSQTSGINTTLSGQADAINELSTRVEQNDSMILATSSDVTQLGSRVEDAETGVVANAEALDSLSTRVLQTEDQLIIDAEDITSLRASITGSGNLLPNSGFDVDLGGWTFFSRGLGWLTTQMQRSMDPERLPPGVETLSLGPEGVPAGDAGIRSQRVTVAPNSAVILSGYLAAENCTARLEWRLFKGDGEEVGLGLVGSVTDRSPADNLTDWERVHLRVPIPSDAVLLELQLWVTDAHNGPPRVWLLRPMVEEAVGTQSSPSPWTPSAAGLAETWATAMQSLTTRVEVAEDFIESQAGAETNLVARIGSVTEWRVTTHATSGTADSVGSPRDPVLSLARDGSPVLHTFQRGLTLIRFTENGDIETAVRYDTYSNATARNDLRDALNALNETESFLLVAQDHHGIKQEDLNQAMLRNGAWTFPDIPGSWPYILLGRGGIGAGNGQEIFPIGGVRWIDHYFTLVGNTPKGLGVNSGLVNSIHGQATAVTNLNVRVTAVEGEVEAVSSSQTDLSARLETTEAALIQEMITSANKNAALTSSVNQISTGLVDVENQQEAHGVAISGMQSSLNSIEGEVTSHTSHLTSLQAQVDSMDTDTGGFGSAISELDTRVTSAENSIESHGQAITSLQNSVTSANKIFAQPGQPSTSGRTVGDLWFDTDDGNKPYVFNGTSWVVRQDLNKNKIFVQGTQPTATATNDLWIDSSRNNRQFRWNGSTWVEVSDTRTAANASAISSLTTRTSAAESKLNSQSTQLTNLENSVDDLEQDLSGTSQSVSNLTSRVSTAEGKITSQGSSLTTLSNKVNHSTTGLTATVNALNALTTRVSATESTNTSQATAITNLTTRIGAAEGVNSTQATAISTLQTRATNIEGVNSSQASAISTLQSTTGSMSSTINSVQSVATSANNTAKAIIGLTSTTNGVITGFKSVNDGTTTSFKIRSDRFQIVPSSSSGERLQWSGGNLRVYSPNGNMIVRIGTW